MRPLLPTLVAVLVAGCATTPDPSFLPRPLTVDVPSPAGERIVARAVVAVAGVRPGERRLDEPDALKLRLALENLDAQPIALEPGAWKLLSADLRPFGAPLVGPTEAAAIPPGGERTLDLYFPVPPETQLEDYDLSGLNLRFGVRLPEGTVVSTASFEREPELAYDPYFRSGRYGWHGCGYGYGFGSW